MKKLRVMVMVDIDLVPPESLEGVSDKEMLEWKTEYDVVTTLREIGHHAQIVGVSDDLGVIRKAIEEEKPHIVFNLLEEFHGVAVYDHHVVAYLELMRQPYTGCNPRGLMLSHDKALCKKLLTYHRIPTPKFAVVPRRRVVKLPRHHSYPMLVKSVIEDASLGITNDSIVHDEKALKKRVDWVHQELKTDALVEEYIDGRELYVGVMGNRRLRTFPVWELLFTKLPEDVPNIATAKVKWDEEYQKKLGVETRAAKGLPAGTTEALARLCKRVYRVLHLSGYARIDLRLSSDGRVYVLEANPNPNLSYGEDFAESAHKAGLKYQDLIQHILNLGTSYQSEWRESVLSS